MSTEQHIDELMKDINEYEEALRYRAVQADEKGRQLWQALGIISDMIQCHPTNDAVHKRARNFLHSHGRN